MKTSALGDIAQSLPVLSALRGALPEAALGWVIDEDLAPLLDGHLLLDELIPVPLRRWRRAGPGKAGELARSIRRLRAFRPTLAIDLMSNHKGALLTLLSGAGRRVGLRGTDRREPSSRIWLNEVAAATGLHAVERALSALGTLGIAVSCPDFAPAALRCGLDRIPAGEFVLIHPGAAWGNKRYPPSHWGSVAERIASTSRLEVRVAAGPGESALADEIVDASGGSAVRLEAPDLPSLVGAIRGASLVLAGDTGAIHIARALDRPLLAVHGPTDPALHGPWRVPDGTIAHRLPCSFCHQRMDGAKACLTRLEPERVAAAALAALEAASV